MPIYKSTGTLTGYVNDVRLAQEYLTDDDMTQYLEGSLAEAVEHVEWQLAGDGHKYSVVAITKRELSDDELKELASWTSGQNSDGLGEGFEQQDFAWNVEYNRWGDPVDDGEMVSFDWQTNDSTFERVK